ncbi:unnamed protein product [Prunus armeniaca]|uniref:Uncharacterized protein n=1 Tax=Prunus armeniaca TaxID=36596 RepID=A0A6J5W1A2_PRUAR|nr:unnamed protein product [Prunus armeniaca]
MEPAFPHSTGEVEQGVNLSLFVITRALPLGKACSTIRNSPRAGLGFVPSDKRPGLGFWQRVSAWVEVPAVQQKDVGAIPLGSRLCIILRQEHGYPCMRALLVLSRALPFGKASVAVVVVLCVNGLRHQSIRARPFWKETSASIRTDTKSRQIGCIWCLSISHVQQMHTKKEENYAIYILV